MNKPPPLDRDYNRDPNIKALKKRRFMNHGSALLLLPAFFEVLAYRWDGDGPDAFTASRSTAQRIYVGVI